MAEVARQRWEAECRERDRREREGRRAEAIKKSRQELLVVVEDWALARSVESFFADAEENRASALNPDEREALFERIRRARALLGGTDALARFRQWKTPNEEANEEENP